MFRRYNCLYLFFVRRGNHIITYFVFTYLFFQNQIDDVSQFLIDWENNATDMCYQVTEATWSYITNITEHNKNKLVTESFRMGKNIFPIFFLSFTNFKLLKENIAVRAARCEFKI